MDSMTVAPNCYGCFATHAPSACPFVAGALHYNKTAAASPLLNAAVHPMAAPMMTPSSPFGANPFAASWPSMNSFETRFPSTWSSSWPSTFEAARFPASWWPSMNFEAVRPSFFNNFWGEKTAARHMLPTEVRNVAFRPASMVEFWSLTNPIHIHPIDGSRMLHLAFDVKGFKPEEVTVAVNLKERCFTVECKHDVKPTADNKEHTVARTYTRKFVIPTEFCLDLTKVEKELKACFTHDGLLIIEAVLPRLTAEELKVMREKCPSKALNANICETPAHFHGTHACSIPIKTIA